MTGRPKMRLNIEGGDTWSHLSAFGFGLISGLIIGLAWGVLL